MERSVIQEDTPHFVVLHRGYLGACPLNRTGAQSRVQLSYAENSRNNLPGRPLSAIGPCSSTMRTPLTQTP